MCVFVQRTRFSVHALSLGLISAEGFKATNTFSWLGTSDILFATSSFLNCRSLVGRENKTQGGKKYYHFYSTIFYASSYPQEAFHL